MPDDILSLAQIELLISWRKRHEEARPRLELEIENMPPPSEEASEEEASFFLEQVFGGDE